MDTMKVKDKIPESIITAAVAILQAFVPELTPTRLIAALQQYDSEKKEQNVVNARPRQSLTLKDACFILNLSRPTIYRMCKRGEIKLLKIGNSTRISAEEVDRLLGN
jgi:excisionase family DNA binding protein